MRSPGVDTLEFFRLQFLTTIDWNSPQIDNNPTILEKSRDPSLDVAKLKHF